MPKFSYPNDPPDAKCPYCQREQQACSHLNSLARAWARGACRYKHTPKKKDVIQNLQSSFKEWSQNNK